MRPLATSGLGFLPAVLWFDLMFDVQVFRYRRMDRVPGAVVDSIATYSRRVTTDAAALGLQLVVSR